MSDNEANIFPGKFYARDDEGTTSHEVKPPAEGPTVVVCRRIEDFKPGQVPPDAQLKPCATCGHLVVFNPKRTFDVPYVCMQCEDIEPLPIEGS